MQLSIEHGDNIENIEMATSSHIFVVHPCLNYMLLMDVSVNVMLSVGGSARSPAACNAEMPITGKCFPAIRTNFLVF